MNTSTESSSDPDDQTTRILHVTRRIDLPGPDGETITLEPGDQVQFTGLPAQTEGRPVVGMKATARHDEQEPRP